MSNESPDGRKAQVAAMFGRLAPEYDFAGCFRHFGQRLVDVAEVAPGHRVLDVACGRGAVVFPTVERVGTNGQVEGIDLSEGMV